MHGSCNPRCLARHCASQAADPRCLPQEGKYPDGQRSSPETLRASSFFCLYLLFRTLDDFFVSLLFSFLFPFPFPAILLLDPLHSAFVKYHVFPFFFCAFFFLPGIYLPSFCVADQENGRNGLVRLTFNIAQLFFFYFTSRRGGVRD